jgi:hypothetical protein
MVARELESGTHTLVWTQSITRHRWLATKLGVGLLCSVAAGAVVGLALTWWSRPIDSAVNAGHGANGNIVGLARIVPEMFGSRGIAPIGYAAFAFALGVAAGALLRRTVPAMAVTLAVYVLIQIVMPNWVRPHLVEPVQQMVPITADNLHGFSGPGPDKPIERLEVGFERPGAWQLSTGTVDASGSEVGTVPSWVKDCLGFGGPLEAQTGDREQACFDRLADEGYRQRFTYQPASHYWALQWRETGVMLTGALVLGAVAFWRVKRVS